jgi:protein required for attachment to host cells
VFYTTLAAPTGEINVDERKLLFRTRGIKREVRLELVLLLDVRNYHSKRQAQTWHITQNDPFVKSCNYQAECLIHKIAAVVMKVPYYAQTLNYYIGSRQMQLRRS